MAISTLFTHVYYYEDLRLCSRNLSQFTSCLHSVGVDWGEAVLPLVAVVLISWFEFLLDNVPGPWRGNRRSIYQCDLNKQDIFTIECSVSRKHCFLSFSYVC